MHFMKICGPNQRQSWAASDRHRVWRNISAYFLYAALARHKDARRWPSALSIIPVWEVYAWAIPVYHQNNFTIIGIFMRHSVWRHLWLIRGAISEIKVEDKLFSKEGCQRRCICNRPISILFCVNLSREYWDEWHNIPCPSHAFMLGHAHKTMPASFSFLCFIVFCLRSPAFLLCFNDILIVLLSFCLNNKEEI